MDFQKTLEEIGFATRQYSGRGMYGRYCLAVVPDGTEFGFVAQLIRGLQETLRGSELDHALAVVADTLEETRTDSLGRSVILYWPNIEFSKEGFGIVEDS